MIRTCIDCGAEFEHESHSWCFACKIQGINLGHVPNHDRESRFSQEKTELERIRATGHEPVRVTGNEVDKRDARKDYEVPRHLKKYLAEDDNKMVKADKSHQVTHDDSAQQRETIAKAMAARG